LQNSLVKEGIMMRTAERTQTDLGLVRSAMSQDVFTVDSRAKVSVVTRAMETRHVSGVPVVEHGILVGMLSMTDLGIRGAPKTTGPFLRQEQRFADVEVRHLMTRNVVTADPDWPLASAAKTMVNESVNRLPVVDALGRPVGIITRDDIVHRLAEFAHEEGT
jgi:CBS domain-containing protein